MRHWLRLPPPLRLAIPALVLVFNLCFVAVAAWMIINRDREREILRVRLQAAQQAARLAMAATERLGAGRDETQGPLFQSELSFAGNGADVNQAVLISGDKRMLYSSTAVIQKGRNLDAYLPEESVPMVVRVLGGGHAEQIVIGDESIVAAHPLPASVKGELGGAAVVVERDLRGVMATLRRHSMADVALAVGLMLLACLGLWLALRSYLGRRARALVERVRPESDTDSQAEGADEFAELSRALRESENRFRQVSRCIRDVFYMVSADWSRVLYVNPAYEEVWGRTVESLINSPGDWMESVVEADREDVVRHQDPLRHGATSVRMEYRIRRPDGTIRWIEDRAFPVVDAEGAVYRIVGLARDVTGRKQLEKELLNATELERRRMGRDLHDDLCQRLAAIKIKCEMFTEDIRRGDPPDAAKATELCDFISQAAALCRGVARTLVPVDLAGEGLMVALDRLVKTMEALHEVPCFFHCPHSVLVESTSAAVHLYRIAQEFLSNAIRHGKPTRVDVRLESTPDFVRVEVVNDGLPFADPGSQSVGMGLKILHFRADAISATMRILPRSDGTPGTIATCLAPHSVCNPDTPSKS
jgi:PAS domain S-box-containing protein